MEFTDLDLNSFYRVLAPRPTIIVTTRSPKGEVNAAPFSFTMPVSTNPPLLAFASVPSHHTFKNLEATGDLVVNIPSLEILNKLWVTGENLPEGVNELKKADLTELESKIVSPPRIAECIAHFECQVKCAKECGDHILVVSEVVAASVREDSLLNDLLDVEKIKPILHLGGKDFVVGDHIKKVD